MFVVFSFEFCFEFDIGSLIRRLHPGGGDGRRRDSSAESEASLLDEMGLEAYGSSWEPQLQEDLGKLEEESPLPLRHLDQVDPRVVHDRRPGFGDAGAQVVVKANHFDVSCSTLQDVIRYDISITPEVSSKPLRKDIVRRVFGTHIAFDGKRRVYVPRAGGMSLSSSNEVILRDFEFKGDFKIIIESASPVDPSHKQQTLQMLNLFLREIPSDRYQVVGRSFFSPYLGSEGKLGNGLIYWKGFYQSLRYTQMGLSLNIDTCARAFLNSTTVLRFVSMYNIDLTKNLREKDRIKFEKVLRGVWVERLYRDRRLGPYKISGITTQSCKELSFSDDIGFQVSLDQDFKYKDGLFFPNLPALQVGNDTRTFYLPMELCTIVEGQRYRQKLDEKQASALLKATCEHPWARECSIRNIVNENICSFKNERLGIHVSAQMTSVVARVLPPPMLKYHGTGKNSLVAPSMGQWSMVDKKMIDGGIMKFWTCINFSKRSDTDVGNFCVDLIDMCISKGMECSREPLVPIRSVHPNRIKNALFHIEAETTSALAKLNGTGKRLQLLIVILHEKIDIYGKIKRVCETELGIISQCFQPKKIAKPGKEYKQLMENVSLKINGKVGGRNSVLDIALRGKMPYLSDRPTIIFGADVTHPQPGDDSSPSIAAVVASMDWPEVTKYRGLASAQARREEIIQNLYSVEKFHGGIIIEHLLSFYKANGKRRPERIIFYRDGVSEGQFTQIFHEIEAVKKACKSIEENYMPSITFIVVQKRHHTRLFAANFEDASTIDRSGNILPGTMVDRNICHPSQFDFYLCSHAGIQGTSRPTHYHVLYDENEFTANGLQVLTNHLCYTYARCTRAVSVAAPAYYAHLVARRARYYVEGAHSSSTGSSENEELQSVPVIKDKVKDFMFFI